MKPPPKKKNTKKNKNIKQIISHEQMQNEEKSCFSFMFFLWLLKKNKLHKQKHWKKNKSWRFTWIHENLNENLEIHMNSWVFMWIHVNSCVFMGVHGCSWVFMGVHGCSCEFMWIHVFLYVVFHLFCFFFKFFYFVDQT